MRRGGPKTPFQPPYRRRDVDAATAPEPNHPIRRTGAIDQRLIEGSQVSSPYFNQFRREDDGSHRRISGPLEQPQSYGHDGYGYGHGTGDAGGVDMQLDAFGKLLCFIYFRCLVLLVLMGSVLLLKI